MDQAPRTQAQIKAEKERKAKQIAEAKDFKPRAAKGARNTPQKQQLRG